MFLMSEQTANKSTRWFCRPRFILLGTAGLLMILAFCSRLGMFFAWGAVLVGVPVCIMIGLIARLRPRGKENRSLFWWGLIGPTLIFSCLIGSLIVTRVLGEASLHQADHVIEALKAYHQDNGTYPDRLDQIVPSHIRRLPHAPFAWLGLDFEYIRDEDSFRLSLSTGFLAWWYYYSDTGYWEFSTD